MSWPKLEQHVNTWFGSLTALSFVFSLISTEQRYKHVALFLALPFLIMTFLRPVWSRIPNTFQYLISGFLLIGSAMIIALILWYPEPTRVDKPAQAMPVVTEVNSSAFRGTVYLGTGKKRRLYPYVRIQLVSCRNQDDTPNTTPQVGTATFTLHVPPSCIGAKKHRLVFTSIEKTRAGVQLADRTESVIGDLGEIEIAEFRKSNNDEVPLFNPAG